MDRAIDLRAWLAALVLLGCGGGGGGEGSADASGSEGASQGDTQDGSADADGSGTTATGAEASASSADASAGSTDTGFIFDVGGGEETGGTPGECNCGQSEFSYIWIANSSQGTVSKLNTREMTEDGRYYTRPDAMGNPSRTSVSIDGKAVAVANRATGLIKIWAREVDCVESNGMPGIQTSTGAADILAWGADECVAWFNPFEGMTVQRPVAWTSGTLDERTCEYTDQKIWTITGQGGMATYGSCNGGGVFVHRVDGETGVVDDSFNIPQNVTPCTSLGAYGAAVDNENDLWFYMWDGGGIIHVDYETLQYEGVGGGSYGITVDTEGRVWTGSGLPGRYDPAVGVWDYTVGTIAGNFGTGIAQDLMGRMWLGTSGGVVPVDMETMEIGAVVMFAESTGLMRGISVDVDGYVWGIELSGSRAFRVDPVTYEYEMYDGLVGAYTYSDMSGGQLSNVTCNPPAG
jgi:streptogramin lyase